MTYGPFGPDPELSWSEIISILVVIIGIAVMFSYCCAHAMNL